MEAWKAQILHCLEGKTSPWVIVIDGLCGSGKTTLASMLSQALQAPVIHMDDFFLPFALRTPQRLQEAGGNIHYERFETEVLPFVGRTTEFSYHRFDCDTGNMIPMDCPAGSVRIVEGSYSLHPRFLGAWQQMQACRVFLSVEEEEQLRRIALRNPSLLERFRQEWIPMENRYFQAFHVAQRADVCLKSPIRVESGGEI